MNPLDDHLAIQRTLNTYSQSTSVANYEAAVATYAPDGVWHIPHIGLRFEGHDALREGLAQLGGTMEYIVQLNSPAIIHIDGDAASATSTIRECGKAWDKDEANEFFGIYRDRLVRTADGWRFAERVFEGIASHSFPLSPGAKVVRR
jgi:ketosteroid isomerase-like protein